MLLPPEIRKGLSFLSAIQGASVGPTELTEFYDKDHSKLLYHKEKGEESKR